MKFDKFMEHCFRILCLVTACVVFVGAVLSCTRPLRGCADVAVPDWAFPYHQYLQSYEQRLQQIQSSNGYLSTILNDTSISNDVKRQYLLVNALQTFDYKFAFDLLAHWRDDDFNSVPSSVTVDFSGGTALYRISGASDLRVCYLNIYNNTPFSGAADVPLVTSNDFEVYFSISDDNTNYTVQSGIANSYFTFSTTANWWTVYIKSNNSVGFTDLNLWTYQGRYRLPYSIPSLTDIPEPDVSSNNFICGRSNTVELPEGNFSPNSPWDYYNNTLLPYMRQNFPDVPDIFYVFPDGYDPSQDPTEPNYINPDVDFNGVGVGGLAPIILGAGAIINVAGNNITVFAPVSGQIRIDGIQLQFPLDNDNEVYIDKQKYTLPTPELSIGDHLLEVIDKYQLIVDGLDWIINGDGTITIDDILYNLPIGEIETLPIDASDYVYVYEIPTLENIDIVDASLAAPDLSIYGNSIQMIFVMSHDVLEDVGALPVFLIILSLSAVGYGLWKIGG